MPVFLLLVVAGLLLVCPFLVNFYETWLCAFSDAGCLSDYLFIVLVLSVVAWLIIPG